MGSARSKFFGFVAFVCLIAFAASLYLYTQGVSRELNALKQPGGRRAPVAQRVNLKPLQDKVDALQTEVQSFGGLKKLAKKETMDTLLNLAVSGAVPKGAPPANISKIIAEQVSVQVADSAKALRKELGTNAETAKLAQEVQALKARVDAQPASGGATADQALQRAEAAVKKIEETAKAVASLKGAGDVAQIKAKADQAGSDIAALKTELAALKAKVAQAERSALNVGKAVAALQKKPAQASAGSDGLIIKVGMLDTGKDGNDIKQMLRQLVDFRRQFDKIYKVNLSSGQITVRPEYQVSYFVSPADLVIPKSSVWSYRRTVCVVDRDGLVTCTVLFTRGDRKRETDVDGVVNYMVIARKVR